MVPSDKGYLKSVRGTIPLKKNTTSPKADRGKVYRSNIRLNLPVYLG